MIAHAEPSRAAWLNIYAFSTIHGKSADRPPRAVASGGVRVYPTMLLHIID